MENTIKIYTDGSARGNPGPAGWGVVFLMDGKEHEIGGRSEHATNNQMELKAAIEALKYIRQNKIDSPVEIVSDSKYVILGITEWIAGWMRNGWRNAAKKPVVNQELWEELYTLNEEIKPKWSYVKGHFEDKHNDRADIIATSFADNEPVELKN